MLVDMEWIPFFAKHKVDKDYISKFDTANGGLFLEMTYPPKNGEDRIFSHRATRRIHKGVYYSFNIEFYINNYTEWNVSYKIQDTQRRLFNLACEAKDEKIKEEYRNQFLRLPSDYGISENLKNIFRYGREFIRSDEPHVLSVCCVEVDYNGDVLHNNGPYVGKTKKTKLEEIFKFQFCHLEKK